MISRNILVTTIILLFLCQVKTDDDPNPNPSKTSTQPSKETPIVDFILSNRKTSKQSFNDDNDQYINNIDPECKTVYIIPGYLTGNLPEFQELKEAYLNQTECHNVILCVWPASFQPDYIQAAGAVYDVGGALGQHIIDVYGKVDLKETIECVGEGLGAHIAGCAGKATADIVPLYAIQALDPSGEFFTDGTIIYEDYKLSPTDATRVICLHTNTNGIGTSKDCGKYDFYANSGSKQPGIVFEYRGYYSHIRALPLFIETLVSDGFLAEGPLGFPTTRYGSHMQKNTPPGRYHFKTNASPPFSRG